MGPHQAEDHLSRGVRDRRAGDVAPWMRSKQMEKIEAPKIQCRSRTDRRNEGWREQRPP